MIYGLCISVNYSVSSVACCYINHKVTPTARLELDLLNALFKEYLHPLVKVKTLTERVDLGPGAFLRYPIVFPLDPLGPYTIRTAILDSTHACFVYTHM